MNKHFVMISIESNKRELTDLIRQTLNKAIDWIEITPTSWLIWTSTSCNGWLKRIQGASIKFENVLILEINPTERAGIMPENFWQFIKNRIDE